MQQVANSLKRAFALTRSAAISLAPPDKRRTTALNITPQHTSTDDDFFERAHGVLAKGVKPLDEVEV
jgi:hypothetical protein